MKQQFDTQQAVYYVFRKAKVEKQSDLSLLFF